MNSETIAPAPAAPPPRLPAVQTASVLAGALVGLFALVVLGAFLTGDHDLVRQLGQGLLNIVIAVASFYFGSSKSSQAKDATIAAMAVAPKTDGA